MFYGEPAIDYGGPTTEFFTVLLESIASNRRILDGTKNSRVLTTAFQVSAYFVHRFVYSIYIMKKVMFDRTNVWQIDESMTMCTLRHATLFTKVTKFYSLTFI